MKNNKSLKIFLLCTLSMLFSSLTTTCVEGCLKCGTNSNPNSCQICDLFSSFYMDEQGQCVRRKIENCLIPSLTQGEVLCAQCKMNYILDIENAKCVKVPSNLTVPNCRQYTLAGTCRHCFQDYYLDGNTCSRVSVIIENCRTYFGDDLCSQCLDDFYFDVDLQKCLPFEPFENCQRHSFKVCESCSNGYQKNLNLAMISEINSDFVQNFAMSLWEDVNFSDFWVSDCLKFPDENCSEMSQNPVSGKLVNSCLTCKEGFYLENGECKANPTWAISNCKEYLNHDLCTQCESSYFLDCNECKPRTENSLCLEGDWNADKCFRCVDSHLLNVSGVCEERVNKDIPNCSKYMRRLDLCETCESQFKLTNDMLACFSEIPNCDDYPPRVNKSDLNFTCDSCKNKYYLTQDKKECKPLNVFNCATYQNSHSNICDTCESDYYLNADLNQCIFRDIPNCKTPTPNENKCTTCENLFKREDDEATCTPINNPDCLKNVENTEDCSRCPPHRYLKDDGTRVICVAVIKRLEVDDCAYNETFNQEISCTKCNRFDASPVYITGGDNIHYVKNVENCNHWQSNTFCTQCLSGYNQLIDSDGFVTCEKEESEETPCILSMRHRGANLNDDTGSCLECRFPDTHFLKYNVCWEKTPKFMEGCSEADSESEKCLICKEGYAGKEVTELANGAACLATPENFVEIPGCAVYNVWDSTRCVHCEWEYVITQQGGCLLREEKGRNYFFPNLFVYSDRKFNFYQNYYVEFSTFTFSSKDGDSFSYQSAVECQEGFVKLIQSKEYGHMFGSEHPGIYADNYRLRCVHDKLWAQKDDGNGGKTPYVTGDQCDLSYMTNSGLFCIKCKNNMNPKYVSAKYDSNGSNILGLNFSTVESCDLGPDSLILSKKYKALGFRKNDSFMYKSYFEEEIPYDSCPDPNTNLVVVLSNDRSMEKMFKTSYNQTSSEERAFCYDFGSSPPVQNCWVFGIEYESPGFNYKTGNIKCISCMPGYAATLTDSSSDSRFISTCSPIPNCDTSNDSTNTYMNACETCESGFVYSLRRTTQNFYQYVDFSTCESQDIDFCLILNEDKTECILCDVGYVLATSNTECTSAPAVDNCQTPSWNPDQIQSLYFNNNNRKYGNTLSSYIQNKFASISAKENCSQCHPNFTLMNVPFGDSRTTCESKQKLTDAGVELVENCKIFIGTEENKCLECIDTHILTTSNECILRSSLAVDVLQENCAKMDTSVSPNLCTTCKTDFNIHSTTGECVKYDHCIGYGKSGNDLLCYQCEEGKMVDFRDRRRCIDIIVPNCLEFYDNRCIKCKPGHMKIMINTFGLSPPIHIYCAKDSLSDPILNVSWEVEFTDYISHVRLFKNFIQSGDKEHRLSRDQNDVYTTNICPHELENDCEEVGPNLLCKKCKPGFYIHQILLICIPINIDNCLDQSNIYECTACANCNHCHNCTGDECDSCEDCTDSYFINSVGKCQKQAVDDCIEFKTDAPGCDKCAHGHYLSDDKCYPHSVQNCLKYDKTSDQCDECNEFYFEEDGKCKAHTISGCKEYSKRADECVSCFIRHYLDNGKCILNQAKNCKTYYQSTPGCNNCHQMEDSSHIGNFVKDSESNCVPMKEIVGCLKYKLSDGTCLECDSNFFEKNNTCEAYPQGVRFCAEFVSPTVCSRCISDYYLDPLDGACKNIFTPIENCEQYTSPTECTKCIEGWILNSDKTSCLQTNQSLNCKAFLTFDSCSECLPGIALVETEIMSSDGTNKIKKCESKIDHCVNIISAESTTDRTDVHGNVVTIRSFTYTCQECALGYLPNDDKTQCETVSVISNCLQYAREDDNVKCVQCNPGYWRSSNGLSCVPDNLLILGGCENAYVSESMTCSMCKAGHMMNADGSCVKCGGDGCAICDPEAVSKCALCAGGYYMNSSYECVVNPNFKFSFEKEDISGGDNIKRMVTDVTVADQGDGEADRKMFEFRLSYIFAGFSFILFTVM